MPSHIKLRVPSSMGAILKNDTGGCKIIIARKDPRTIETLTVDVSSRTCVQL